MTNEGHLKEMGISISKRKSIFLSLVLVNIIRNMGYNFVNPGFPDFVKSFEGTVVIYGLAIGILQITQTIFQLPYAFLSNKIGRKKAIAIGYVIHIIGTVLCGFSTQIWQIILYRAISGIGVYASVIFATLSDLYDESERAKHFSFYTMSLTVGYILGNFLGGVITDYIESFSWLFFISAILNFIGFVFLMGIIPETNMKFLGIEQNSKIEVHNLKKCQKNTRKPYGLPFIFGLVMHGVKNFFFGGFLAIQIWYYTDIYNLSGTWKGIILLILTIFYIIGLYIAPKLRKKISYFTYIIITSIALAVFILATSFVETNLYLYVSTNLLLAFTLAMQDPITTSYVTNHMDENNLSLGSGILSTVGMLFYAIGQISISGLAKVLRFQWLHITSSIFWAFLIGLILLVNYILKNRDKKEQKF
ncbi:MAG: MFS transporter [Promethearchaeota archaeon]|nr:MAG: MFS transporter [Candidatus Lokiarchaeota archaeon]